MINYVYFTFFHELTSNELEMFVYKFIDIFLAPQVLCEMERAIADTSFSLTALDSFLFTTKEIWMK